MTSSLSMEAQTAKMINSVKIQDFKRFAKQRKHLMYLVRDYLEDYCSKDISSDFADEMNLSDSVAVCDNIDLETILTEYTENYYKTFRKYPTLCKTVQPTNSPKPLVEKTQQSGPKHISEKGKPTNRTQEAGAADDKFNNLENGTQSAFAENLEGTITVKPMINKANLNDFESNSDESAAENLKKHRILKPIKGLYPNNLEFQEIARTISREIVVEKLNVQWDDIIDYKDCKDQLNNAIFYPRWYPELFNGKFAPWQGILLVGPPGTGKTMLAKAVATACKCTFFNITSSSIVSKWRGDSEKYVRVLFDLAKYWGPTVIFIDEVDWVSSNNEDCSESISEPARRFRAEFLARFDGLLSTNNANVFLLAATNLPWNIDAALLRRFEKKIFVNLPNDITRQHIFEHYIDKTDENLYVISNVLVQATKDYSCADLKLLCKETRMQEIFNYFKISTTASLEPQVIKQILKGHSDIIQTASLVQDYLHVVKPIGKTLRDKYGNDKDGNDKDGNDKTGNDKTGNDKTGNDKTGNDKTGNDKTGNDKTSEDKTGSATLHYDLFRNAGIGGFPRYA